MWLYYSSLFLAVLLQCRQRQLPLLFCINGELESCIHWIGQKQTFSVYLFTTMIVNLLMRMSFVISLSDSDLLRPKVCNRRPWSAGEKAAVWRQLGQFITLRRVPGKEQCLKALEAEPALRRRSWKDIKNQVYNSIKAQKRQ